MEMKLQHISYWQTFASCSCLRLSLTKVRLIRLCIWLRNRYPQSLHDQSRSLQSLTSLLSLGCNFPTKKRFVSQHWQNQISIPAWLGTSQFLVECLLRSSICKLGTSCPGNHSSFLSSVSTVIKPSHESSSSESSLESPCTNLLGLSPITNS